MIGFVEPVWLIGLTAIAVPIALHFWGRRTGRPLLVGSIRFLADAPPAMTRRPRIHDPWLLALRCAILAALVSALARPYWAPDKAPVSSWALVADNVVDRSALIDSLNQRGATVRSLDHSDLWAGISLADRNAMAGTRFEVFADPLLRDVHGTRPVLHAAIVWHPRASIDRHRPAPERAIRARIVTLFADASRAEDARYVGAAMRAVGLVSGLPAIVTPRAPGSLDTASVASSDWIIWLSGLALPDVIRQRVRNGATLLSDAGTDPATAVRTRVVLDTRPTDVWRTRRIAGSREGAAVWSDVTGAPLLTVVRDGRGLLYRFHSRFTPSWSDVVLQPGFPEAIARLWIGSDPAGASGDDRPIALDQVTPARDPTLRPGSAVASARSLFLLAWLFAVGLFLAERRLAAVPHRGRA